MWVFVRNAVLCAVTLLTWAGVAMAQGCDDRFPRTCPGYFPPFPESGRGARLPAPPRVILPPPARMPEDGGRQPGLYAPLGGEPFPVPPVDLSQIEPRFLRRVVPYPTSEPPGTIIIDPQAHYLYLVQDGGMAIRYGVGVGRQGFSWSGNATVHEKREWPDWYPPKEMIERQPEIRRQLTQLQSGVGVPGGLRNPLGARALYLWQGNKDTLYRIHGTNEPWTIGRSVSSGCIRMINQDVIDLYDRVPIGAKVVVLGGGPRFGADHETAPRRAAAR
ncbi:MAG TPA: L,D-transpeptidase [Xanthobacteraceae bacterium]|nr:L,D-transpeptidase [Xanthobacteraceae bacterium]